MSLSASLDSLIGLYGYWAVLLGTFLEGETILLLGGFAAAQGYLHLPLVMLAGFAGSTSSDQLFFFLGRRRGRAILARRPNWEARVERVHSLMERHANVVILGFRFLYGLRNVTPLALGLSRVSAARFVTLNLIGAAIWAVTVSTLGYLFGNAAEVLIGDVRRYEIWLLTALAMIGFTTWLMRHWLRRRFSRPPSAAGHPE